MSSIAFPLAGAIRLERTRDPRRAAAQAIKPIDINYKLLLQRLGPEF